MKIQSASILSFACSLALLIPAGAAAQSRENSHGSQSDSTSSSMQSPSSSSSSSWRSEASEMVPARAAINHTLDAKDARPGQEFQAKLPNKVHLKNGPELPAGTVLVGKVAQDDMQQSGKSKLALCINEAKLKDGKTIPVKATIVGVYGPGEGRSEAYPVAQGDQVPNTWTQQVQQVDQLNAMSGIDLHSRIGSQNSGVLVSTKKDDIKLKNGTELALAIAAQGEQMSSNGGGL